MQGEYSRAFKEEAVRLAFEEKRGVTQTARDLDVSKSAIYRWRNELNEDGADAFPGKGKQSDKDAEIRRLKRQLHEAQMENEILKKATAIFARTKR